MNGNQRWEDCLITILFYLILIFMTENTLLANSCQVPVQQDLTREKIPSLVCLATADQAQGNYQAAWRNLQKASAGAEQSQRIGDYPLVLNSEGDFFLARGDLNLAKDRIQKAVKEARKIDQPLLLASTLNHLGNLSVVQKKLPLAVQSYQEAITIAEIEKELNLYLQIVINLIRAYKQSGEEAKAVVQLQDAFEKMMDLPRSYQKAFQWVSLGKLAQDLSKPLLSYQAWKGAISIAEASESSDVNPFGTVQSYAYGYLGNLHESRQRYDIAIKMTRKALFFAQESSAAHLLYRWQWQLGRLFEFQGNRKKGVELYRQAVTNLQSIRQEISSGVRLATPFRDSIGKLYYELADLLLQMSAASLEEEERNQYLFEARRVMEQFKGAELQDYFNDGCVTNLRSKIKKLDRVDPHTAVLYPISLADRLVLLLSFSDEIQQFSIPLKAEELDKNVDQFRRYLQNRGTYRFIRYSKKLHQWLIAPIQKQLEEKKIDTLVIVPDGKLRTIPFAALYDSENGKFLIQDYALAITPSLDLTDPKKLQRENLQVLLNGLSVSIDGFAPLPNVPIELESIKKVVRGRIQLNQNFTAKTLERELKESPYSIVHIASHGQFDAEPKDTFLLTYQGKMTMDQVSQVIGLTTYRDQPIELLVLSACQTALGDDRAALGLAGVAIKAGARSALASLWFVDDAGTSLLMGEFYRQLQNSNLSKAKVLQLAQQYLLKQRAFRHPAYWASFLLIGNWL